MDNFTKITKKRGGWSDHFVSKYEMIGVLFSSIYNKLDEVTIPIHSRYPKLVNNESLRFSILYGDFDVSITCDDIDETDKCYTFTRKIKDKHIDKEELWGFVNDYVRHKIIGRLFCEGGLVAEDCDYSKII